MLLHSTPDYFLESYSIKFGHWVPLWAQSTLSFSVTVTLLPFQLKFFIAVGTKEIIVLFTVMPRSRTGPSCIFCFEFHPLFVSYLVSNPVRCKAHEVGQHQVMNLILTEASGFDNQFSSRTSLPFFTVKGKTQAKQYGRSPSVGCQPVAQPFSVHRAHCWAWSSHHHGRFEWSRMHIS